MGLSSNFYLYFKGEDKWGEHRVIKCHLGKYSHCKYIVGIGAGSSKYVVDIIDICRCFSADLDRIAGVVSQSDPILYSKMELMIKRLDIIADSIELRRELEQDVITGLRQFLLEVYHLIADKYCVIDGCGNPTTFEQFLTDAANHGLQWHPDYIIWDGLLCSPNRKFD